MGRVWGVLLWAAVGLAEAAGSWARFYGDNVAFKDLQLTREGMIALGALELNDNGEFDAEGCSAWVARLDLAGEIAWQKCYRGVSSTVTPTREGGYLLAGSLALITPRGSDYFGGMVVKLDSQGGVQWQKVYDAFPNEARLIAVQETAAGYVAIGEIEPESGASKAWILGLDQNGNLLWQRTLTGFTATTLQPTRDGSFLIAGTAEVSGKGEAWLLKLDANGQGVWQKTYGGEEELPAGEQDVFIVSDAQETSAGDLLLAGGTFDTVPDPEGGFPEFRSRAWIAKLDQNGRLKWRKIYGEQLPFAQMVRVLPTSDGGFLALGIGGDPKQGKGLAVWLAKLTAQGEIEWQKLYGKAGLNDTLPLKQLADGKLLLAGASFLNTRGDWLLKLGADGSLPECSLEGSAAVVATGASLLRERAIARVESPPAVTVRPQEAEAEDRSVVALPACPVSEAFGSCSQIQTAGKSYGDGSYPVVLKTPTGPELLGARCAMNAFGGGWMLIARRLINDPRPPSDFVHLRFGEYDGFSESFSIWPVVDWNATSGVVGLSWIEDFEFKASLLSDLSPEKLQAILATSPQVDAWVR